MLNHSGFASVDWSTDKPFAFIFGENVVHVHPILAEFFSPRISRLRRSNASVDRYAFKEDCWCAYRAFEEFISQLSQGKPLDFETESLEAMKRAFEELENQEILSSARVTATEFVLDPANPVDGICGSLFDGLNLEVTANSPDAHCWLDGLVLHEGMNELLTYGDNPWICIDFGRHRVKPTAYVMRSGTVNFGSFWPRDWVIEVSKDGSEGSWQIIDSWKDFDGMAGENLTCHFEISDPPEEFYRFFRVRVPADRNPLQGLDLSYLEVFGTLLELIENPSE